MDLTEFGLRLVLLFIPGIICAGLIDTLTTHRQTTQFRFTLRALIWGVVSYGFLSLFKPDLSFFNALSDTSVNPSIPEAAIATGVAVVLALTTTYIVTHKLHFRIAQKLRLTRRYGDQDIWGYLFNSTDVDWAVVRDHKRKLVYDGFVKLFSDDSKNAELYMTDVRVYDNASGDHLYDVPGMYLSLDRTDMTIEFQDATMKPSKGDTNA